MDIPGGRDRVIRVYSFSKAFSMTGWRVGFLHADARLIKTILPYHDAMVTCAPVASQYAAIAALRCAETLVGQFTEEYRKRRELLLRGLEELSHVFDYQMPHASYFVFPRIKDRIPLSHDSQALAYDILEKAQVATVPGIAFGPSGESHLRLSFGRDREVITEAISRLSDYFSRSIARARTLESQPKGENKLSSAALVSSIGFIGKRFLSLLAKIYLGKHKPQVIGVTGLRGRTVFQACSLRHTKSGVWRFS